MTLHESQTLSIDIDCPLDRAYAFLSRPENFSQWAAGLGSGITRDGDQWTVETPGGPAGIRFSDPNPFGVLDHTVHPPGGGAVYVPMRVVANGDGCLVTLTLFRAPDFSDAQYQQDIQFVRSDLATLKQLLEA